jgi:hypothetical protein
LDTLQSALSKSKTTPEEFCYKGNSTEFFQSFRFGMTLKRSDPTTQNVKRCSQKEGRCQRNSSYAAGFRNYARTLAPQGKALALMASEAAYGVRWHASFAKYDHDLHLWKTHQCSLLEDYIEFSETWPRWGSMRNGECLERKMLEPIISEIEYGLWATPSAGDGRRSGKITENMTGQSLPQMVNTPSKWPTPRAFMHKDSTTDRGKFNLGEKVGGPLNPTWVEWLMNWPSEWTDLKPLETVKCRDVQLKPSDNCRPGQSATRPTSNTPHTL